MAKYILDPADYNYEYSYNFGRTETPRLRIRPGDEVVFITEDASSGTIKKPEDLPSASLPIAPFDPHTNPQTGPVIVEGAEIGDVLRVKIKSIEWVSDQGFSSIFKNLGALQPTGMTAMLNDSIPERTYIWKLTEDKKGYYNEVLDVTVNAMPFLGTIGVAPGTQAICSQDPGSHGGNMDVPDMSPGKTVYLPVMTAGAYFSCGDVHARQGDGEICGTAIEIPGKVTLEFSLIKNKTITNPRMEDEERIYAVGSARPMEDALRLAYMELIKWMCEDYGYDKYDAYELLSIVGNCYVGNMVDTWYSLCASIEKKYLKNFRK